MYVSRQSPETLSNADAAVTKHAKAYLDGLEASEKRRKDAKKMHKKQRRRKKKRKAQKKAKARAPNMKDADAFDNPLSGPGTFDVEDGSADAEEEERVWKAGDVIDVELDDGWERGVTILGPSLSLDPDEMQVRFQDGEVDDWPTEDFSEPQDGAGSPTGASEAEEDEGPPKPEGPPDVDRELFDRYDVDGTGELEKDEVQAMLFEMGFECNDDYLQQMITRFDADKSGTVGFSEFKAFWNYISHVARPLVHYRALHPGVIKAGFEKESERVGSMFVGEEIVALEIKGNRVRYSKGWVSVVSEKGALIIEEVVPQTAGDGGQAAEAAKKPPEVDRARFDRFDEDKTGELEMEEIQAMMEEMGYQCDSEYLDQMMDKYDTDSSGSVDFGEFKEFWNFISNVARPLTVYRALHPGVVKDGFDNHASAKVGSMYVGQEITALEIRGKSIV